MKMILILAYFHSFSTVFCQTIGIGGNFELDKKLQGISTIIEIRGEKDGQGSGFFYSILSEKEKIDIDGKKTTLIESIWLVTNRHVLLAKDDAGKEIVPDTIIFNFRVNSEYNINWEQIKILKIDFNKFVKLHINENIDVALIDIESFVKKYYKDENSIKRFNTITNLDVARYARPKIETTDDVIILGYPKGFYDYANLFPIIKQGIIASYWGLKFNGQPYFLIDAKLFPGSSGSLVMTKPKNIIEPVEEGIHYSTIKKYYFLGIYSGEPFKLDEEVIDLGDIVARRKDTFDVGIVWYYYLVDEIINSGIYLKE